MAFMSCFSTASTNASNLPTIRLISRSKISFVIVVAFIDSFKILITWRCLFLSIFFLLITIFVSGIVILEVVKAVIMEGVDIKFSLISSYSPNQIFLRVAYSFIFSIHRHNICLRNSLDHFLVGWNWLMRAAKTFILLIGISREIYFISLSKE